MKIDRSYPISSLKAGDFIGNYEIAYIDGDYIVMKTATGRFTIYYSAGETIGDMIVIKPNLRKGETVMGLINLLKRETAFDIENPNTKDVKFIGKTTKVEINPNPKDARKLTLKLPTG